MKPLLTRRSALGRMAGSAAILSTAASLGKRLQAAEAAGSSALKGRINHSVCKWCYPKVSLEDLCQAGKEMGLSSIELLEVKDFDTLKKHGLMCAMITGVPGGINRGLNRLENHDKIVAFYEEVAPKVAAAGLKNIICFSGDRKGMSDEQGLENCAIGLKRIAPICEKHKAAAAAGDDRYPLAGQGRVEVGRHGIDLLGSPPQSSRPGVKLTGMLTIPALLANDG